MSLDLRSQIITRRTYNRPKADGSFESWAETVDRVINHQRWLWERAVGFTLNAKQTAELEELRSLILQRKAMVSGRTLWLGGTEIAKTRECSQFNCAASMAESVYDLVDLFWLLLNGSGTGFKPVVGMLRGFIKPIHAIEAIPSTRSERSGVDHNEETFDTQTRTWTIKIGDSAEAWAKAVGKLIAGTYPADKLVLDFSNVRPAGGRLKGYGWLCSGAAPFQRAMEEIAAILNRRAGSLLSKLDILDVVNWLGTVLSTRRSAQIALCDYGSAEWEEFALAKREYWVNNPQRCQSNNSLMFWDRPSHQELSYIFDLMVEGGGGEPGFINAQAMQRRAPWSSLLNPCFAPDTLVVTKRGAFPIQDLVGRTEQVFDGTRWVEIDNFRVTGHQQPLLEIEMHDGAILRVTPRHTMILENGQRVEAQELRAGDKLLLSDEPWDGESTTTGAYIKGFCLGDGTLTHDAPHGRPLLWLYSTKSVCQARLLSSAQEIETDEPRTSAVTKLDFVPDHKDRLRMTGLAVRKELVPWCREYKHQLPTEVYTWDAKTKAEFIAGLFDADGTAFDTRNGFAYQFASVHLEFLRGLQTLLKSMGVRSKIAPMHAAREHLLPDGRGGSKLYQCKASYRLTISQEGAIRLAQQVKFERLTSFADKKMTYKLKPRAGRIAAIRDAGVAEKVYCCTVPGSHAVTLAIGVTTGQCAEILLANKGFCNLVTLDVGKFHGDSSGLHRAYHIIARANYRQTCVDLRDGILQEAWHLNNQFLRLCGVSMTGFVRRPDLSSYELQSLQRTATVAAYGMADELDMPRPKNVTTQKPEGTASKVMGTTEGMHKPLGRYIFNNVAFSKHDDLVGKCRAAGYRVFENPQDPTSVLITFPVEWADVPFTKVDGLEVNTEAAVTQLERYKLLQTNWCQQNVSATISYDPSEIPEMVSWLQKNWDDYVGVSFLFRNDPTKTAKDLGFSYLPQEVVSRQAFETYVKDLAPLDLDNDSGEQELLDNDCAGGVCPVR